MKNRKLKLAQSLLCITALLATSAFAAGKHQEKHNKADLKVDIREWNMTLSAEKVKAGKVNLAVTNHGKEVHEFVVIKFKEGMSMAAGRFPIGKDGEVNEDQMNFGTLVGEIEGLTPGDVVTKRFNLEPGKYALICNMLEREPDGSMEAHYSMGMHTQLTVE